MQNTAYSCGWPQVSSQYPNSIILHHFSVFVLGVSCESQSFIIFLKKILNKAAFI